MSDTDKQEILRQNPSSSELNIEKELMIQNALGKDTAEQLREFIDPDQKWWKTPHLLKLNLAIFLVTLTSTNNGYDGSMLNGLQSLDRWQEDLGHPTGHVLGALANGVIFGGLLGTVIGPWINDRFGRRVGIFLGQFLNLVGSILQGVSTNYAFFLISRIVLGFGSLIAYVGSPTLISEISYPTHRSSATGFYNTCWYLGAVIAAWVTYGTRDLQSSYAWRIPSYLQGAMPLIQLIFYWLVPESPRYYISKGKFDKAEAVLSKYHIGNSQDPKDLALVEFEMKEIQAALEMEKISNNASYLDFLKTKAFRKRLFIVLYVPVLMQLSGNGLVSYYLNKVLNSIGITEQTQQLEINGCLMIYNMVISMGCASVFNYFKRKTLFMLSSGLMCLFYVIWTALSAINVQKGYPESYGNGVLAMIFLYYAAYDLGMNGLPVLYLTEILPYSHRAKGLNAFQLMEKIVLIYNGYVNPIAMEAIDWKYYIVYCCLLFTEVFIIYFFFVETSGKTLEEVAECFGDSLHDHITVLNAPVEKAQAEHVERASTDTNDKV